MCQWLKKVFGVSYPIYWNIERNVQKHFLNIVLEEVELIHSDFYHFTKGQVSASDHSLLLNVNKTLNY